MYYVVDSSKSFYEAGVDLREVILRLGFSLLHVHDLGTTLRGKGCEPDEDCQVFAVGNARMTEKILAIDIGLSALLPWRISVFTDNGNTRVGLIKPLALLSTLSRDPALLEVAREMEEKLLQMIDDLR